MLHLNLEKLKNNRIGRLLTQNRIFRKLKSSKPRTYFITDFITFVYLLLSGLGIVVSFLYIGFYFKEIPTQIPLWYSLNWGAYRLSIKEYIYFIPFVSFVLYIIAIFFSFQYLKNNIKEVARFISTVCFGFILFLSFSAIYIVNSSVALIYVFGDIFWMYFMPFFTALIISFVSTKLVIKLAPKLKIIEYPKIRNEPQKVLQTPTPRGGAIPFFIGFAITTIIFLFTSQKAWGLVIGTLITTVTGYFDDRYRLSFLPRLIFLLPLAFVVVILSGFVMFYLPNPFGEAIKLDYLRYTFELFGENRSVVIYGAIASFLWFMWMSNMLSWNNGIDGQFVAISSIAVLAIGILSFRNGIESYEQQLAAQLSFIALGSILGLFWFTFPPQRIIWGFGATGVGLIIAALSILSGTRVASATLVLLIPTLDTAYVIFNRLKNRKSPFLGDANHLHHKLLHLGLTRRQIALIYWVLSIMFLVLSLFSSENTQILMITTMVGLALYVIIAVRFYALKRVKEQKN